jgi:hypothetical protein
VIDSSSSQSDSDKNDQDVSKLLNHKNILLKRITKNRIKKAVDNIAKKKKMKEID